MQLQIQANASKKTIFIVSFFVLIITVFIRIFLYLEIPKKDILAGITHPDPSNAISCFDAFATTPKFLLIMGQSNAANHGTPAINKSSKIVTFFDGKCYLSTDPLPGATGHGSSIWTHLPAALDQINIHYPLLFMIVAVESTSIQDWSEDGLLNKYLINQIDKALAQGFYPDVVLWQQGEADAQLQTTQQAYKKRLAALMNRLQSKGITAPFIAALSTRCRDADGTQVRQALAVAAKRVHNFYLGPDTDTLQGTMRKDKGCHFSEDGLIMAANMWASYLQQFPVF